MNTTTKLLSDIAVALGEDPKSLKKLRQLLENGFFRDLAQSEGYQPDRRHLLRDALNLPSFRIRRQAVLHPISSQIRDGLIAGRASFWGVLLPKNAPSPEKWLPGILTRASGETALFEKVSPPQPGESPNQWIESYCRTIHHEDFMAADALDLVRLECQTVGNAAIVAPRGFRLEGQKGERYLVEHRRARQNQNVLRQLRVATAQEIADLAQKGRNVCFLARPLPPDEQ